MIKYLIYTVFKVKYLNCVYLLLLICLLLISLLLQHRKYTPLIMKPEMGPKRQENTQHTNISEKKTQLFENP